MTDKEVKKLKRTELLEMLIEQTEENEKLKSANEALREQLAQRTITLENAGSIAQAALQVTKIFSEAQDSADRYLESIRAKEAAMEALAAQREKETADKCAAAEQEVRARCEKAVEEAKSRCEELEKHTREKCEQMIADAKRECAAQNTQPEQEPPAPAAGTPPEAASQPESKGFRLFFGRK